MKNPKKTNSKARLLPKVVLILFFSLISVAFMQAQTVGGTVVDEEKEPLVGVSVAIKGTTIGTMTDMDGKYSIQVNNASSVLVFSIIGSNSQEVTVGNKTVIDVTMKEDSQILEEVVVVGFQSQKKVNLTGSVASVSADVFENKPIKNVGQALQGVIPNLNISTKNGGIDTAPDFNIRGGTSLVKNEGREDYKFTAGAPLILVDGIEISVEAVNNINPNDIDNMSVIKDASAAAIYGTKATFGVILIQTKGGGFNQKSKISYSYDLSWDKPAALPDILDSYHVQLSGMEKTLWTNGKTSDMDERKLAAMRAYIDDPVNNKPWFYTSDETRGDITWVGNFNPYKRAVKDWTPTQKHNVSISGGSSNVGYYLSFGYQDQEGLYKIASDRLKRHNVMMNVNAKVTNWFNIVGRLSFNQSVMTQPYLGGGKGSLWKAMREQVPRNLNSPIMTAPDDPNPNMWTDNVLGWLSYGANSDRRKTQTIISVSPEFTILPKMLKMKMDIAYNPNTNNYERLEPKREYIFENWKQPMSQGAISNRGQLSKTNDERFTFNAYADFNKTFFQKHTLSSILGFNQEVYKYNLLESDLDGLFSPQIANPSLSSFEKHKVKRDKNEVTTRGFFGRVNYNFDDRFLVEANGRIDGSSKFTKDDRFVFFPSFSGAWRISQESFMANTRSWLDNLKIRASYGKLGSQPSQAYPYQSFFDKGKDTEYILDGERVTSVQAPNLMSPKLSWEKAATTNLGIDATFLSTKLDFSFDVYQRRTTDIIVNGAAGFPSTLGTKPPLINSGVTRVKGWEMSIKWMDKLSNGLRYDVGLILSDNKAKVLSYEGNSAKLLKVGSTEQIYPGYTIGDIWGYETGGILQESDFEGQDEKGFWIYKGADHKDVGTKDLFPGQVWYKDLDGDGRITEGDKTADKPGDKRVIGNNSPRYNYGIMANVSYKGFDLNLFFQGVAKRDVWIESSGYWGGGAGSQYMYDRSWRPDRTDARFPMYDSPTKNYAQTGYLIDGSYFRLKQAVLGYTLPASVTQRIKMEKVRFTLSGYNIFEITDIPSIFDVDQVSDAYPQRRTVALGVQVTF